MFSKHSRRPIPPWKTSPNIVKRVTELTSVPPSRKELSPRPGSGRTFMCLPQHIRFNIYERLLASTDPIMRPWPRKKFNMQLLRVSKDIFAETAYLFYGKGDGGLDLDAELDLMSSYMTDQQVLMQTPLPPHCHQNVIEPIINFATGRLGIPPEPYASLITHLSLSNSIPWTPTTLASLPSFPNLTNLRITVHFSIGILNGWPAHRVIDRCNTALLHRDHWHNNFLRDCVVQLNNQGIDLVEVELRQQLMQEQDKINTGVAPLQDWIELPALEVAWVMWEVTVDERRQLVLSDRDSAWI